MNEYLPTVLVRELTAYDGMIIFGLEHFYIQDPVLDLILLTQRFQIGR